MDEYRNIILYLETLKKEIEEGKEKKDLYFTIDMIKENIKNNINRQKKDLKYQLERVEHDCELMENFENFRKCSSCKKEMKKGYCINNGEEYYCSDLCLYKNMSVDDYKELYKNNCAYYTEWEQ